MRLFATVKQLGKKKPALVGREIVVEDGVSTLRELIGSIVVQEVERYNARTTETASGDDAPRHTLLRAISREEVDEAASSGKVGFGLRYGGSPQDIEAAVENAILSFEDGLYRVFVGEDEITALDAPLSLRDGNRLTFIRLVMLAGRLW